MRSLLSKLIALGFAGLAVSAPAAPRKEPDAPKLPPPQPVPQKVSVPRGGKVEITLKVYERPAGMVQYRIRNAPDTGKLSAPKRLTQNSATVVYEPPADFTVKVDRFSYAAQTVVGVSAPADVSITIIDEPSRLIVPTELTFEPILAGTSSRQEITIKNDGGSLAEGELEVDKPFVVEGDRTYRLGHDEKKTFGLIYAPGAGGSFRSDVRYTSHRDRVTTLVAEARHPLSLTPPKLDLRREANETARSGAIEIANLTSEPQTVKIVAGVRWKLPESLELPPLGTAPLVVKLPPEDTALVRESVKLQGAGIELTLPIEAAEVPAVLRAETATVQMRGAPGRTAVAQASVRNAGGHQGYWKVETDVPFTVDRGEISLGAGQVGTATVRLDAPIAGRAAGAVRFIGEQQTVTVPIEVEIAAGIAAPMRASLPPTTSPLASISTAKSVATAEEPTAPPVDNRYLRGFPLPVPVVTPTTAVLEWPAELTQGQPLRAELRKLSLDQKHKMQVTWVEMPTAHFSNNNGKARAYLEHLAPGTANVIRISAAPPSTQAWRPLFQMPIVTPAAESVKGVKWWLWGTLLALAVGAWFWQRRGQVGTA